VNKKSSATAEKKPDEHPGAEFAQAPVNASLDREKKVELYRTMVRIRRFEERSLRAYQAKNSAGGVNIGGFLHLYIGQEAVAVSCCSLMGPNDHIITAYRDHGHAIAVGMDTKSLMAELFGKATGCSKGKGGSMHFFDPSRRYWGGHGIVGGQVPLGTGIAFALKQRGLSGACMTFLGDGAVNQGAVHEAYNLAALWQLPVVFIIENNGYSMGTSQARSSAGELARRAEAYGMDWGVCEGHHIYEVRATVDRFLTQARQASKPSILEVRCYRYRGHSVSDPDVTYRTKTEIDDYRRTKDPIQVFQQTLIAEGSLDEAQVERIDTEARAEADNAAAYADASPYPELSDIQKDVYWEADHPAERKSGGKLFFD
jgi:pyruvate dehydrogenase E1 component alpha subunit